MRLLQRYILWELLRTFAFLLGAITVLLVFVGVFQEMSESGLGPADALKLLPFIVPSLLPFTIPATLLLTVTVVYGRMAGDKEITAAKAAGINLLALLWPSFLLGAVLSIASLFLSDQVIPWAVTNIRRAVAQSVENIFLDMLRTRHVVNSKERGLSITVMGVDGRTLILPTFQYAPHGHEAVTVQAEEGVLEFDLQNQQVMLHLVHGNIDSPGRAKIAFDRADRSFPMPHKIRPRKSRHLSIREIRDQENGLTTNLDRSRNRRDIETALAIPLGEFDRLTSSDASQYAKERDQYKTNLAKLLTEVHNRFALSTSCLFFVLLGGPFAIVQGRRQFLTSFLLCFLPILLLYYPIVLLMINLSKTSVLPPWSVWTGNVLLLAVALSILRKVLRH